MFLVQALAVVGVLAQPHLGTAAQPHFLEPVRVRQGLPGKADDIRLVLLQQRFGLGEGMDAAGHDHRGAVAGRPHRGANRGGGFDVAAIGAELIGDITGHALVTADAGVGVGRLPDFGLFGIIELAAPGQ